MNIAIESIRLDEVHIRCYNGNPEVMMYISLLNDKKNKLGQFYIASQKGYSDTKYNISEGLKTSLIEVIETIRKDLISNYITHDISTSK